MLGFTMFFANTMNVYFFFNQTKFLKWKVFTRLWSLIDLTILTVNYFTIFNNSINNVFSTKENWKGVTIQHSRIVESILMLLLWFKSLYFLALIP